MLKTNDYAPLIKNALKKNESILFSCNCTVHYSGRAESFLGPGDRIVLIKPDNTIIIHQPTGNNPVNYMKPGAAIEIDNNDKNFVLNCKNLSLKEYLTINIVRIHFFNSHRMEDGQTIQIQGTEKDMAEMIYYNPSVIEEGFKPLSMEEHTKYGFIDVFGYDKDKTLTIIECKRYAADLSAVQQLRRYVEKIKSSKGVTFVRGILAAPRISSNAEKMLNDWGFEFKALTPPKYLEKFNRDQKTLMQF